jgi:hypothetical protein
MHVPLQQCIFKLTLLSFVPGQVICEVEDAHAGEIIEALTLRKGEVRWA